MRKRATRPLDRAIAFDQQRVNIWRKSEKSEASGVFLETGRIQKVDAVSEAAYMERYQMWAS